VHVCVYQVQQGDTLINISTKFGKQYSATEEYNYCVLVGNEQCESKERIIDNGSITPGKWIIIPGVDKDACVSGEKGKWILE
jgi:hypothetical protein